MKSDDFFFFVDKCSNLEIAPNSVEHAYLAIVSGDLDSAYKIFKSVDSPRAHWGEILVGIIKNKCITTFPTYFQIRNFFEIDTDFLIKNKKIDYVENLLGALEVFSNINQEVYKFAGRVMFENKLYAAALKYLEESKKVFYNDPELHFMLSKYYIKFKKYNEAYFYVNECLKYLPSYYPALLLKQQIEENGF
ncbi:hypothetical protein IKQ21_01825 [bacterium]|nr:hypothetical protein [bacterium]